MDLTPALLPAYVGFLREAYPADESSVSIERLLAEIETGKRVLERTKVLSDAGGSLLAVIRTEPVDATTWLLTPLKIRPGADAGMRDGCLGLIADTVAYARAKGAGKIESRVPVQEVFPEYARVMRDIGFALHGGRIEFRTPLEDLPADEGTPFRWNESTDQSLDEAAVLINQAAVGDPDWDPSDDWRSLLKPLLADPYLNGGPDCVHVGTIDGQTAAVIVSQAAPSDGWSRITYMGLLPAWRGRGLGRWLHRHGFAMLKAQNGRTYHGGTSADNRTMLALFRGHGCKEYRSFDVWLWRAEDAN